MSSLYRPADETSAATFGRPARRPAATCKTADETSAATSGRPARRPAATCKTADETSAATADRGAPDFYLATNSNVFGWGGGVSLTTGLGAALESFGYSYRILGIDDQLAGLSRTPEEHSRPACDSAPNRDARRLNVCSGVPPRLWRVRSWCLPRMLARTLRRLPAPRAALVGLHPYWVLAARRAWPEVPVVFTFACLLTNCLPFTWPRRRPPSFWARVEYAGIRRAERTAFRQAHLIVAPTLQSVQEIRTFEPGCAERLVRCDYGVRPLPVSRVGWVEHSETHHSAWAEPRRQKRRELGLAPDGAGRLAADHFVIAVIGRCDRNKAFDWAVRALPDLDARARLLVVGSGPESDKLRQLAQGLGVAGRVTFAGSQRDVAPWYAAADCVLSTSFYDTFPNVLLEAMYAGRPIVVPEHDPPRTYSGLAELVREHGCGRLYRHGDLKSLTACLNELVRSPAEAASLGEVGRALASARLRWTTLARCILQEFRSYPRTPLPLREGLGEG